MDEESRFGNMGGDRSAHQGRYSPRFDSQQGGRDPYYNGGGYNNRNADSEWGQAPMGNYTPQYDRQNPYGYNSPSYPNEQPQGQGRYSEYVEEKPQPIVEPQQKKKGFFSMFKKSKESQPMYDTSGQNMIITKPRTYQDVKLAIDNLRRRQALIVEFSKIPEKHVQRILDFMSGAVYALGGSQHRIGDKMFLLTPEGMSIQVPIDLKNSVED